MDSSQATLDRATLACLEALARDHLAAHDRLTPETEAAWIDRGEKLADAVEAFRALVKPDHVARIIRQGMAR